MQPWYLVTVGLSSKAPNLTGLLRYILKNIFTVKHKSQTTFYMFFFGLYFRDCTKKSYILLIYFKVF